MFDYISRIYFVNIYLFIYSFIIYLEELNATKQLINIPWVSHFNWPSDSMESVEFFTAWQFILLPPQFTNPYICTQYCSTRNNIVCCLVVSQYRCQLCTWPFNSPPTTRFVFGRLYLKWLSDNMAMFLFFWCVLDRASSW